MILFPNSFGKGRAAAVFLLVGLVSFPAFSQQAAVSRAAFPRLSPDPQAQEYAAMKTYTWEDFAKIALWASGVEPEAEVTVNKQKTTYMAALTALADELAAEIIEESETEKAQHVLRFMYEKTLKRYSLNQTRIDTLLTSGTYNCVSSAVYYLILGARIGLDVRGVITRDHAFIAVATDGTMTDIETTNKFGFNPGEKKEFFNDFGKTTGFAYVPPGNYRNRAEISRIELVSLIIANRISALESRRDFPPALPLAIDREALLHDRENPAESPLFGNPAADIMDRIFNVAGSFLNSRKEEQTLQFADYARPVYPDDERWEEIQFNAVNNLVTKNLRSNNFDGAKAAAAENRSRYDEDKDARLLKVIDDFEAATAHNNFAALFNRRKYTDAKALLHDALLKFPANKQLERDLALVEKALKG